MKITVRLSLWLASAAFVAIAFAHKPAVADVSGAADLVMQTPIVLSGAAGKFDFMASDAKNHRIFAAHPSTNSVAVVDTITGHVTTVDTPGGINGIAFDDVNGRVFLAGPGQKLVALDSKSLRQVGQADLNGAGDSVMYDPKNGQVYVDNDDGTSVWVFNPKVLALKATITIPEAPEVPLYDAIDDKIYQNIKSTSEVVVIDPTTNSVTAHWPTAPAAKPHGMALDIKTQRLFSAGANGTLAVFDIASAKVIASVHIASKVDQIAFDQGLGRIYCASADGLLSVVQETVSGADLLATVSTTPGAKSVAVDGGTHNVWIAYADDDNSYLQEFAYKKLATAK